MKISLYLSLFLTGLCIGLAAEPKNEIALGSSSLAPRLHMSVAKPSGWSAEWYKEGSSIIRLSKDGTDDSVAMVIAVSPVPPELHGKGEAEIFSDSFLMDGARGLKATVHKRITNDRWNGAYFEYPLPRYLGPGRVQVKNWMMISDGYIVQFQCYYHLNSTDSEAVQKKNEELLDRSYQEILESKHSTTPPSAKAGESPVSPFTLG